MVLVDNNLSVDVLTEDARWLAWSAEALAQAAESNVLVINPITYAKVSVRFDWSRSSTRRPKPRILPAPKRVYPLGEQSTTRTEDSVNSQGNSRRIARPHGERWYYPLVGALIAWGLLIRLEARSAPWTSVIFLPSVVVPAAAGLLGAYGIRYLMLRHRRRKSAQL